MCDSDSRNPARWGEVVARFPQAVLSDVEDAVGCARAALPYWRRTPAPQRAEVLRRAADILADRREETARAMTREMGKVLLEARGDVQEGVDMLRFIAGEGRRLYGETTTSELQNKFAMCIREPVGVCGLITPWNFPLAIPSWKTAPALVAGNTVVLKPAEDSPLTAQLYVEALLDAGLPPGVLNLVFGDGSVGAALAEHPGVDLISFTGSTETGRSVATACARTHKRVSLEMGGKNATIVMPDADLPLVLDGVTWGAFGTSGQRCTATSRVVVHRSIAGRLAEGLAERAAALRVGDGLEEGVQVGPLVNGRQLQRVEEYVEIGRSEGARVLTGGARAVGPGLGDGWFYLPTVFSGVSADMRIAQEEIFGPVVCVIPFDTYEEAVEIVNGVEYGLSASIYTNDTGTAFRAMHDLETGIVYINSATIGAEVHLPFGGVKRTGNGHREGGHSLDAFTEWKTVYVDYSGRLQRAQIDVEQGAG